MLGVLTMVVRQIIRNGGFDPEDVARLDAAFTAAWKQIEFRFDLASEMERDASREKLAVIIVAIGKSYCEIDAVELQARALAMFDTSASGLPMPPPLRINPRVCSSKVNGFLRRRSNVPPSAEC